MFGVGPSDDPDKAKALLGGKTPELTLCYADSARRHAMALAIQDSLQKSGFKIDLKPVDAASYYTIVGKKDTTCDIFRGGWGSDWPNGSTIIPPLLDGRSIQPTGNQNLSYYNIPTACSPRGTLGGSSTLRRQLITTPTLGPRRPAAAGLPPSTSNDNWCELGAPCRLMATRVGIWCTCGSPVTCGRSGTARTRMTRRPCLTA